MPSTHVSLHCHFVFSTKNRDPMIELDWEGRLHQFLGGIITKIDSVPHEIGGMPDHVHMLIGMKATHCVADIMREVKSTSSESVHNILGKPEFAWQVGYGAFSVSSTNLSAVRRYINGQKIHHSKQSYQAEYVDMLKKGMVEYDDRYLW